MLTCDASCAQVGADSGPSKFSKAKEVGTPLLDEAGLLQMIAACVTDEPMPQALPIAAPPPSAPPPAAAPRYAAPPASALPRPASVAQGGPAAPRRAAPAGVRPVSLVSLPDADSKYSRRPAVGGEAQAHERLPADRKREAHRRPPLLAVAVAQVFFPFRPLGLGAHNSCRPDCRLSRRAPSRRRTRPKRRCSSPGPRASARRAPPRFFARRSRLKSWRSTPATRAQRRVWNGVFGVTRYLVPDSPLALRLGRVGREARAEREVLEHGQGDGDQLRGRLRRQPEAAGAHHGRGGWYVGRRPRRRGGPYSKHKGAQRSFYLRSRPPHPPSASHPRSPSSVFATTPGPRSSARSRTTASSWSTRDRRSRRSGDG